jgi:hypothetical protein
MINIPSQNIYTKKQQIKNTTKIKVNETNHHLAHVWHFSYSIFKITSKSAALWTEKSYIELADQELDCEWKIFILGDDPTIAMWLSVSHFNSSSISPMRLILICGSLSTYFLYFSETTSA